MTLEHDTIVIDLQLIGDRFGLCDYSEWALYAVRIGIDWPRRTYSYCYQFQCSRIV
jgi:hypothetical protein